MSCESAESTQVQNDRSAKQHLDTLKGFTCLESFDQLRRWTPENADPLAISNIPILDRQALFNPAVKASKVMLIHDYKGGYNPYEACQGAIVDEDMYSCEYLQHVETFVYFSHKLVTIPPPAWINTCHRNGVPCLGTFIVEPGTKDVECILEEDDTRSLWVAHQLALIADKHGFDGWLVNIERSFPVFSWNIDRMEAFLHQLRRKFGIERRVVWYDALTTVNFVWYQNTLNSLNLTFARAAGSILTNYAWNPQLAKSARDFAEKSELGVDNVYFGIDVWAQNVQTGRNRRVTFPVKGGGGTGTGLGLQALKELGLGAGIFAPGWSFEHFSEKRRAVERSVWLGDALPVDLTCECSPECPHEAVPYEENGIVRHAARYSAGSSTFFHTDFKQAFTPAAGTTLFADIGSQSVLPFPNTAVMTPTLEGRSRVGEEIDAVYVSTGLHNNPARLVIAAYSPQQLALYDQVAASLHLFDLMISGDRAYELEVSYFFPQRHECTLMLVVQRAGQCSHRLTIPNGGILETSLPPKGGPIIGISIDVICEDARKLPKGKLVLLELSQMTIRPSGCARKCELSGIRIEQRGEQETKHHRLVWEVNKPAGEGVASSSDMPVSSITGPCAYFMIYIDGQHAGKAYALEFVLPDRMEERDCEGSIEVRIVAIGFDGSTLAIALKTIRWPTIEHENDEWVWVTHKDVYDCAPTL